MCYEILVRKEWRKNSTVNNSNDSGEDFGFLDNFINMIG